MAYLDDLLARDEQILLVARRHPLFLTLSAGPYLGGTLVLWIVAVLAFIYVPDVFSVAVGMILGLILLAVSAVPLFVGLYRLAYWRKERYVLTTFRIIQVEGLLNRKTLESALEKVNDVVTSQSVIGRIFNFGSINIVTASDAAINEINGVAKPFEFKRALVEAKLAYGSRELTELLRNPEYVERPQTAGTHDADTDQFPTVESPLEPSRAVVALTELRNAGLISDAEFNDKLRRLTGSG